MSLLDALDPASTQPAANPQTVRFGPKMKVGEINKEVSWIITHKRAGELGDLQELAEHKSVSVRRKVAEAFRLLGEETHVGHLERWLESESDRETYVKIETALDAIGRRAKGDYSEFDAATLTVSEALSKVKTLLGEKTYILEAEVTEAKNYYQMYYFTIKDPESQATLNCRCYQNVVFQAGFPLNEGLQVRVSGKFVLDKYSRLLFDAKQLQLTGEGELARNLALLQEKLEGEGLMDPTRKRTPRRLPRNILLLASGSSAALTDFTKVLGRRRGGMTVYHLPIKTQGVGAESEILARLRQANTLTNAYDIDTIVMTRGGGSKEDLILFNREAVVRAVHALNRPTIVAIGHERDTSLAELVADVRASTPSQAAELASAAALEVWQEKSLAVSQIHRLLAERCRAYRTVGERLPLVIDALVKQQITAARAQIRDIDRTVQQLIRAVYLQTHQLASACEESVAVEIRLRRQELGWTEYMYNPVSAQITTRRQQASVLVAEIYRSLQERTQLLRQETRLALATIEAIHPQRVLEQGYALVEQGGRVVTSPDEVQSAPLEIIFAQGRVRATPDK